MKYFYVRIRRLSGHKDFLKLNAWAQQAGLDGIDYDKGGWTDSMVSNRAPHLRFKREEDAMAYILAHGGLYETSIPEAEKWYP